MYVSDSLFFIQHLFTDAERDENHGAMFSRKFREIIEEYREAKEEADQHGLKSQETAEDIVDRMVKKSERLSGIKV